MNVKLSEMINQMSVEELRRRLAEYMENDVRLLPKLVAVEVRLCEHANARCRYDVLLIDEDGNETPVQFRDRCARLMYIYTLLHPRGYQRYTLADNDYRELRQLYSRLYFTDSSAMMRTINSSGFDHFVSHYVAQSRVAVRQAHPLASPLAIDRPQSHKGRLRIPFVANGGTIIIDPSLSINNKNNY